MKPGLLFILLLDACGAFAQVSDFKNIDFSKADSIAAQYPNHSLLNIKSLSGKLTMPLETPVEKFRAIYRWVCENIESDNALYEKNKRKREKITDAVALEAWTRESSRYTFSQLIRHHKTVCTGYAYLVRELAFHAGITAVIVDGYGRNATSNIGGRGTPNHSWNAVKLNNKWYLCDATWSSGVMDMQRRVFVKRYDDAYFLAAPEIFIRNHYPLDTRWILLKDSPTPQQFLDSPITYRAIYPYTLTRLTPGTFIVETEKEKPVTFTFGIPGSMPNRVDFLVAHKGTLKTIPANMQFNAGNELSIDHVFLSKGSHTVHILFDAQYVCTYRVVVK